jgi:uncharacterized protein YprB with RNaseH-like and TPR domain
MFIFLDTETTGTDEKIPVAYLQWLSGADLDEDMAHTVKHHFGI